MGLLVWEDAVEGNSLASGVCKSNKGVTVTVTVTMLRVQ